MMKLNQLLVITAIPVLLGTSVLTSINKANAANPFSQTIARNEQPKPPAPKPERPAPKPERPAPRPERPAPKGNFKAAFSPASLTVAQNQPPGEQKRPRRQKPNLKAAAEKLGISEEQLKEALGPRPQPDFAAAASNLGTSEGELKEALGLPENPPEAGEGQQRPKPDFKAAAAKLGVTEQQIKEAFGPRPKRDLTAAASKLGISEEQLKEALGVPENPPERPE